METGYASDQAALRHRHGIAGANHKVIEYAYANDIKYIA
jgi:hypothetical protein